MAAHGRNRQVHVASPLSRRLGLVAHPINAHPPCCIFIYPLLQHVVPDMPLQPWRHQPLAQHSPAAGTLGNPHHISHTRLGNTVLIIPQWLTAPFS